MGHIESSLSNYLRMNGDQAKQVEGETSHNNFSQTLLRDHFSVKLIFFPHQFFLVFSTNPLTARLLNNKSTH